jgi:glutathione peroxidase
MKRITDFNFTDIQGKPFDLKSLEGKKVLVVNTASECGYTPQFTSLQELYENTSRDEFEIIGFPCNDFGAQDPKSEMEIQEFCTSNFGVKFPMMAKVKILGSEAHPLFQYLQVEEGVDVKWNFQKYLFDEKGCFVISLSSDIAPLSEEIISWIEKND